MKKITLISIVAIILLSIGSCSKKDETDKKITNEPEWKKIYPTGREVKVIWTDTIFNKLYGIATFVDNGERRKFTATLFPDGTWDLDSKTDDLQMMCKCENCEWEWAINMNMYSSCCIPCPICNGYATSAYCMMCYEGWLTGFCWFIWV